MFESVDATMCLSLSSENHAYPRLVPTAQEVGSSAAAQSTIYLVMTVSRFEKNEKKTSDPKKEWGPLLSSIAQ